MAQVLLIFHCRKNKKMEREQTEVIRALLIAKILSKYLSFEAIIVHILNRMEKITK